MSNETKNKSTKELLVRGIMDELEDEDVNQLLDRIEELGMSYDFLLLEAIEGELKELDDARLIALYGHISKTGNFKV